MTDPHPEPAQRAPRHVTLRYWGAAILLGGLLAAELVYVLAADDDSVLADEVAHGRMYEHNLRVMGGRAAVLFDRFDRWFAGLWHGRPLAYTIAVLAVAMAGACFVFARLMAPPAGSEHGDARER